MVICITYYCSSSSCSSSHIAAMASRVNGAMVRQNGVCAWASTFPSIVRTTAGYSRRTGAPASRSGLLRHDPPARRRPAAASRDDPPDLPRRDAVFAQKPNFRFRGTLHPRATVRRDAAGFTDEQRIIVRRQGLHFTAFLQTRQQLVLLSGQLAASLPSRIRVNSGTSSGSCG